MYKNRCKNLGTKKKKKIYRLYFPRVPMLHKTVIITMMGLCGQLHPNPVFNDWIYKHHLFIQNCQIQQPTIFNFSL